MSNRLTCRRPSEADLTDDAVGHLVDLINRVYDEAESGMWRRPGTRTSRDQVRELLKDKRLILADLNGTIVGSVNVNVMDERIAEFGMLVADPDHRGLGIGSMLVKAAEDWARSMNRETMRLELLTPRSWSHPSKEFVRAWYTRLGYVPQFTEPLENTHPELVGELATECDFTVWHKPLKSTPARDSD
jgi:GNAT superfamily N-acetyltransferase